VLAFNEPEDYLPKAAWYGQFAGKKLSGELQLKKAIRPIAGATLTARATTEAVRRVLAIHEAIGAGGACAHEPGASLDPPPGEPPGGRHRCVYFVMKHLLTSEDPFAVVNHPLQPAVQHLHVLAGPLADLRGRRGVGRARAAERPQGGPGKRRSGLLLMAGFPAMAASGYLLQVSAEPPWRDLWLWMHWSPAPFGD
jgi:hypothetical protein